MDVAQPNMDLGIIIVLGILALALFFLAARFVFRWALRLAMLGLILFLLLGGLLFWWVNKGPTDARPARATPATTRPAPSQ